MILLRKSGQDVANVGAETRRRWWRPLATQTKLGRFRLLLNPLQSRLEGRQLIELATATN